MQNSNVRKIFGVGPVQEKVIIVTMEMNRFTQWIDVCIYHWFFNGLFATFKMLSALGCSKCSDLIEERAKLFIVFNEATAKFYLGAAKGICSAVPDESGACPAEQQARARSYVGRTSTNFSLSLLFSQMNVCRHLLANEKIEKCRDNVQGFQ